jgi:small-conductance mechanosensitive channel
MSEKNIRLGHFISIDGKFVGKVMDIGLRATVLRSIDNTHFIIPNSDLIEKSVLNLTLESRVRRIYVPFKIAYGSDIKKITKLIVNAVNGATHIKILREIEGRKPNIWVHNMGESFIELELFVWIEGYRPSTKSNLLILIHETLIAHQIKMPYPQLDIHLKKPQSGKLLSKNFLGETFDK